MGLRLLEDSFYVSAIIGYTPGKDVLHGMRFVVIASDLCVKHSGKMVMFSVDSCWIL